MSFPAFQLFVFQGCNPAEAYWGRKRLALPSVNIELLRVDLRIFLPLKKENPRLSCCIFPGHVCL